MQISRPIVFLDFETTSKQVANARIVQIATVKLGMDGKTEEKTYLINPQIPIPAESTAIHGITDEMVKNEPTFKSFAKSFLKYLDGCDLAGYNSDRFDIPILVLELERSGLEFPDDPERSFMDIYKYETVKNPNTLANVYLRYTGEELKGAHDALADTKATVAVLFHQTQDNENITPKEIDLACQLGKKRFDISGKTYINEQGIICWNFGTHYGSPISKDAGYLNYWLNKPDFPKETKNKLLALMTPKKGK